MTREIYLDNNATTKPLEEVCDAIVGALGDGFGNPSSAHVAGDRGRDYLRNARHFVGRLLGTEADGIVFTSSGTEANNMVLLSAAARSRSHFCRIVTASTEHSSVLKMVKHLQDQGIDLAIVPVGSDGLVDLEQLEREITPETSLVSVQWVNNETGVIQPIESIGEVCRARGVCFHTDACQAAGKLLMDVAKKPIDLLTLTAHKFHGPQGVGAVYARDPSVLVPMFHGGPQESELRAGTENLPGIVGFGKAAEIRVRHFDAVVETLGQLREAALEVACLTRMQHNSELVESDPLALAEIQQMTDDAREHLQIIPRNRNGDQHDKGNYHQRFRDGSRRGFSAIAC